MIDNDTEMREQLAVRSALLSQLHACGMRPLPDSEAEILRWFADKNVLVSAANGYIELTKDDGSAAVPSSACETLRRERPELFLADPKRDKVSSRADLERGSQSEISRAKAIYVSEHGLAAWERLPQTKAEAERKAVVPSPDMTAKEYRALPFSDRVRLSGIIGPAGVGKILGRKG
jgi:hypothetical protein